MASLQKQPAVTSRIITRRSLIAIVGGVLLLPSTSYGQRAGEPPLPGKAPPPPGENVAASSVEGELIAEVRIVGNKSMPLEKITPHIRMRAGRNFSMQQLQEDARSLDNTRMFVGVKTYTQRVPNGIIVIFDVLERPMLMDVKVIGNVPAQVPAGGTLRHKGWRATKVDLPSLPAKQDATVIAPAEIEIE